MGFHPLPTVRLRHCRDHRVWMCCVGRVRVRTSLDVAVVATGMRGLVRHRGEWRRVRRERSICGFWSRRLQRGWSGGQSVEEI